MRILWFSNTSSLYESSSTGYNGGGWIASLEQLLSKNSSLELGVSFFHPSDDTKIIRDKVSYYPIARRKPNKVLRLINNWRGIIESRSNISRFMKVIVDFKPDVIHIFGTEGAFGHVQKLTCIPVIIHIQGLINPSLLAFYPPGISYLDIILFRGFLKNHILGNSILFDNKRFNKQAEREKLHLKESEYLMGRTSWDRCVSNILAPNARYFHVNEVLRSPFYSSTPWKWKSKETIVILSTISATMYKGFDVILNTAKILKEIRNVDFIWHVAGIHPGETLSLFYERKLKVQCKDVNVVLEGRKDATELIEMISDSSVFVHPSYIDNSPNSVCEAQIVGLPVIACNVGGLSSIIQHSVDGILVPPNSPYELASAIYSVSKDEALASILSDKGRKIAMARHDREVIAAQVVNVYKELSGSYADNHHHPF